MVLLNYPDSVYKERSKFMKCQNCGCELPNTAKFCSSCGCETMFVEAYTETVLNQKTGIKEQTENSKATANEESALIQQGTVPPNVPPLNPLQQSAQKKTKKSILAIALVSPIIIIAIFAIILSAVTKNVQINLYNKYSDIANENWCTIDTSGKWISIDTNPYNIDKDDFTYTDKRVILEATEKIKEINLDLGFTEALYQKMSSTTALQGTQYEENEKYKVSWSYHPDNGLEVMYEYRN